MVTKAEERWRYLEQSLEMKVMRVHEIESWLAIRLPEKGWVTTPPELGGLYWWTFNAFKIKGIVEAKRTDRSGAGSESSSAHALRGISRKDLDHFHEKWPSVSKVKERERNILVIDPFLPMFDRASGSLRLLQILKALLRLGYHITFIARDSVHSNQYLPMLQEMGIEVYAGDPSALEASGINCIAPYLDLERILKDRVYQTVVLDFWNLAEYYLPRIRKYSPSSKIIVDTVDIHFLREIREAELRKDPELQKRARTNKEREIAVYRKADRLWVVTEEDRRNIEGAVGEVPIDIVPNVHEKVEVLKRYEATSDLLFVGNFNHLPNRDGIAFFCEEVFPRIQRDLPGIKLYIVGNNPPENVKILATDRIIVTGYVKDLSPYLLKARISVSPLRYGAGMKGKVGEALSWGLPVVTTSIGAEGMGLVDGEDARIADSAEEFAAKVVRLYNDRDLWERLSTNGKNKVEASWSTEAIKARLESILGASESFDGKGLVSIVIPVHNQLEYTQKCLDSILTHTDVPFELILVDNGSSDPTAASLRGMREGRVDLGGWRLKTDDQGKVLYAERTEAQKKGGKTRKKRVESRKLFCRYFKLVRNNENRGFAAGNNQGMAEAQGDYIVLMNNDVVVTAKWLKRMIACAEKKRGIGMVGPMSNYVSGPQWVKEVTYDTTSLSNLDRFSERYAKEHDGKAKPFWRVVGFCMLIKRAVVAKIGGLDERYGLGNFEDDDFSLRAALAGFESWIAMDCFVHHFGNRTFQGAKIDYRESLNKNWEIFKRKWSLPAGAAYGSSYDLTRVAKEGFVPAKHYCPLFPREYTVRRGEDLFEAGDLEGAQRAFDKVLVRHPRNVEALNNLGVIAFRQGQTDQALDYFEAVLEIAPSHFEAMENLGNCMAAMGRHREAVDWLEKALQLKPGELTLLNALGNSLIQLENFTRAREVYDQSFQLDNGQHHIREILSEMERLTRLEAQREVRP
jgi:GT2 family glycosyltransferase/glycosyltransferase involved in cell wall biosynthesis